VKTLSPPSATLRVEAVCAAYGAQTVLHDVSLTVAPGEILALIGPNGAGKTTLLRTIGGILPMTAGRVQVDGQNLASLSPMQRARILSVVPQARQMGGAFTVAQAVMMGRTAHMGWLGHPSQIDRAAVALALRQTQLETFAERPIAQLSGGEQQRVLLARALAQSTPVMLLDEPTAHLDLRHQFELLSLLRKLTAEKQLAVLMAIHDLNLVSRVADRVALLVDGRLQAVGTPGDVLCPKILRDAYKTEIEIVYHPVTAEPLVLLADVKGPISS